MNVQPEQLAQILSCVGLGYHDWLDVGAVLHVGAYWPLGGLYLFNRWQPHEARVRELLRVDRTATCIERFSTRPVHDGHVAVLELVPDASGEQAAGRVTAFVEREELRDAESFLRACYGDDAELGHEPAFRYMDYPMFDNGHAFVGYGVMLGRGGDRRRWLFSRIAYAHK